MIVEQMDLFDQQPDYLLNGFYYERSTKKLVSFVFGRRHYEILASRCRLDKEWKEKIMKERSI